MFLGFISAFLNEDCEIMFLTLLWMYSNFYFEQMYWVLIIFYSICL